MSAATSDAPPAMTYLKIYECAHSEHVPKGVFRSGNVVLFRATQGDGSTADEPYMDKFEDALFGWQPRVASAVLAEDIPGGHSSLLQEPHVRVLAEKMQKHLDVALRMADMLDAARQPTEALSSVA